MMLSILILEKQFVYKVEENAVLVYENEPTRKE